MWNKAAFTLVGLLALAMISSANVLPPKPQLPAPSQTLDTRTTITVSAVSTGDYWQASSDFYLVRKSDFDRALMLTLEVIGAKAGPAKHVTMFVTFLAGDREQLVAISPIVAQFFPGQPVFVRIVSA
jgi:hypothetical protein